MKAMYVASYRGIEKREVIRETEKFVVTINTHTGREAKQQKETAWDSWHNSFEDARQCLLHKAKEKLDSGASMVEKATKEIERLRQLKET